MNAYRSKSGSTFDPPKGIFVSVQKHINPSKSIRIRLHLGFPSLILRLCRQRPVVFEASIQRIHFGCGHLLRGIWSPVFPAKQSATQTHAELARAQFSTCPGHVFALYDNYRGKERTQDLSSRWQP